MQDDDLGYDPKALRSKWAISSFANLVERLSDIGWVVVRRRTAWSEEDRWVLVQKDAWDTRVDLEPLQTRGLGGRALGLPASLSHAIADEARANSVPPRYPEFLTMAPQTLDVLDGLIEGQHSQQADQRLSLDELANAARACVADNN